VIATLLLTACATAPSRPSIVCPPVAAYDRTFQARLADEIQRLPPGAALEQALLDYARLRDQARACSHVAHYLTDQNCRTPRRLDNQSTFCYL
jgi:hypothetical protein